VFAPYIDLGLTASWQLLTIQQQSGIRVFTLGFVVGNGGCTPTWGGVGATVANDTLPNGTTILSLVQGIRAAGGDVIISFGGASGTELALGCSTATSLQAAYQSVINKYSVNSSTPVRIDLDIEGGAILDQASINRRNQALVGLKAANPNLVISYTLPVLPTGLVASGVNMLNSIKAAGLNVNVINIMAMDYGPANDNGGQMGLSATQAASNTHNQVVAAGLTATIGVTPMIGINDVASEIFQLSDAQMLLNFATQTATSPGSRCGLCHATTAVAPTRVLLLLFAAGFRKAIGRSRISSSRSLRDLRNCRSLTICVSVVFTPQRHGASLVIGSTSARLLVPLVNSKHGILLRRWPAQKPLFKVVLLHLLKRLLCAPPVTRIR
jgi:hypothetical protein